MQDSGGRGKVARERETRAYRLPIEKELVVVPAKSSAHGPIAETNQILDEGRLFEVRAGSKEPEGRGCAGIELCSIGDDPAEILMQE